MSPPGESFHGQGSRSRPELHVRRYLPERPSPSPFGPPAYGTTRGRCDLPEGWPPSHPLSGADNRPTKFSSSGGKKKKKKAHAVPPRGLTCDPLDSPPASKRCSEKKLGYLSLAIYHVASTRLQDMRAI